MKKSLTRQILTARVELLNLQTVAKYSLLMDFKSIEQTTQKFAATQCFAMLLNIAIMTFNSSCLISLSVSVNHQPENSLEHRDCGYR